MLVVLCAAAAFLTPPTMLLGADGLPMKKGGGGGGGAPAGGGSSSGGLLGLDSLAAGGEEGRAVVVPDGQSSEERERKGFTKDDLPDDLKNFDPTVDPLAAERPKYDLAAASGRPDEVVWGAIAPESHASLGEWAAHLHTHGTSRVLGLFDAAGASARASDGTPQGFFSDLVAAGFEAAHVGLLDPRAEGAREAALSLMEGAAKANERICVCCADGHALTSVVLADWLLTDYIGGENYEEACHALAMRKRLAGVERKADPEDLERWIVSGKL